MWTNDEDEDSVELRLLSMKACVSITSHGGRRACCPCESHTSSVRHTLQCGKKCSHHVPDALLTVFDSRYTRTCSGWRAKIKSNEASRSNSSSTIIWSTPHFFSLRWSIEAALHCLYLYIYQELIDINDSVLFILMSYFYGKKIRPLNVI